MPLMQTLVPALFRCDHQRAPWQRQAQYAHHGYRVLGIDIGLGDDHGVHRGSHLAPITR